MQRKKGTSLFHPAAHEKKIQFENEASARAVEIKFRNTVATINGDANVAEADTELMETSEYVTSATDTIFFFSFCYSVRWTQIGEEISRALNNSIFFRN